MLRRKFVSAVVGFTVAALIAIAPAGALGATPSGAKQNTAHHHRKKVLRPPAKVNVGRVVLARRPNGKPALLVSVRYPIEALGRRMSARVKVAIAGGPTLVRTVTDPISAGAQRRAERRRSVRFVHEIDLGPGFARALAKAQAEDRRVKVGVQSDGSIDVDGDGRPDIASHDTARVTLRSGGSRQARPDRGGRRDRSAETPFCGSIAQVSLPPGGRTRVALPACDRKVDWTVGTAATTADARVSEGSLLIAAGSEPGSEQVPLNLGPPVQVTVTSAPEVSVRAIGDSVTAGFGYYSDGSLMSIFSLPECKPVGQVLDDACSSNSTSTKDGEAKVPFAPDYGLANNVSWAAQWANRYGITNYKNLAVSGAEPQNLAPGGSLYGITEEVEKEDPDYILMTIGANPILANTLFGLDPMECALEADIFGDYKACVEESFFEVHLREELRRVYTDLVQKTDSTIYVMQYHLSIPSSALAYTPTQIAEMGSLLNQTIAEVAAEVESPRLQVVTPPHFNTGLDLEPVYPATYNCGYLVPDHVDGPSVQSTITQYQLRIYRLREFCGETGEEEPWVISGDTGIHPSAAGYTQMAWDVPAPR